MPTGGLVNTLQNSSLIVGVDTGAANACVVSYTPAIPALKDGMVLWFKAAATNTGATTLNVNGLGAQTVVGGAHSALQGGEILANGKCLVVWSATLTAFILVGCTGGALQIAPSTQSNHAVNLGQFAKSLATNGYQKLPSGLIIQWGVVSCPASYTGGSPYAFSLPISYPTAHLLLVASNSGINNITDSTQGQINGLSQGKIVWANNHTNTGDVQASYISIGY